MAALPLVAACSAVVEKQMTAASAGAAPVRVLVVAQFQSLAASPEAAAAVTVALVNELKRRGRFEVIEAGIKEDAAERWTAARLGRELRADAVLVGVVKAFEYRPGAGSAAAATPTIAVDVRLVASRSSEIMWAAGFEANRSQVLSSDDGRLEQLAQDLAADVVDALEDVQGSG